MSEVAGADLSAWLHRALQTTEELDYGQLAWLGLRTRADAPQPPKAWLGLWLAASNATLKNDGGRLLIAQIRRGTPAFDAGLNVDDEILAIGDYRVRPDLWESRLEAYRPGDRVSVLVARREHLMRLDAVFAPEPPKSIRLEPDLAGEPEARERLVTWLKP